MRDETPLNRGEVVVLWCKTGQPDELGVARRDVRIVAGASSRQKLVVIDGVDPDAIVARWPGLKV